MRYRQYSRHTGIRLPKGSCNGSGLRQCAVSMVCAHGRSLIDKRPHQRPRGQRIVNVPCGHAAMAVATNTRRGARACVSR